MTLGEIIESLNNKNPMLQGIVDHYNNPAFSEQELEVVNRFQPQKVLIVYGSLAPGKPNHHKIEHIQGSWMKATIHGNLEARGWGASLGFYAFCKTQTAADHDIEAFVLLSDELESNWQLIDAFEGNEYKRILTEYKLENGELGVGNVYALA